MSINKKVKNRFKILNIVILLFASEFICLLPQTFFVRVFLSIVLGIMVIFWSIRYNIRSVGIGLNIFVIGNFIYIIFKELILQLKSLGRQSSFSLWHFYFDYSLPTVVIVLWSTIFLICLFFQMVIYSDPNLYWIKKRYRNFFVSIIKIYRIYFLFICIYVFFVNRTKYSYSRSYNFIPFKMMFEYFQEALKGNPDILLFFFGNIFMFIPLGFYIVWKYPLLKKDYWKIGFVISGFIELSQLIFSLGQCDVDDLILNTLGFYLGAQLKKHLDMFAYKYSNGKENSLF